MIGYENKRGPTSETVSDGSCSALDLCQCTDHTYLAPHATEAEVLQGRGGKVHLKGIELAFSLAIYRTSPLRG